MPVPLSQTAARWREALAGQRPVIGMWVVSGSPVVAEICAGSGLDWLLIDSEHAGIFLGPADLAASLGHLGEQAHPEVTGAVEDAIKAITAVGKPAGVNSFPRDLADRYLTAGARFVLVGADVTLLVTGSEELATRHRPPPDTQH